MEQIYSEINPSTAKSYLKAIGSVYRTYGKNEQKKKNLHEQFEKVLKISKGNKPSKKSIDREMAKLKERMSEAMMIDKHLLESDKHSNNTISILQQKMEQMGDKLVQTQHEKENLEIEYRTKVNELNNSLMELKEKLNNHILSITEREEKLLRLEEKIRNSVDYNKSLLLAIEQHIIKLEGRHQTLGKSGDYNPSDLMRIESKLNSLKERVNKIKARAS